MHTYCNGVLNEDQIVKFIYRLTFPLITYTHALIFIVMESNILRGNEQGNNRKVKQILNMSGPLNNKIQTPRKDY